VHNEKANSRFLAKASRNDISKDIKLNMKPNRDFLFKHPAHFIALGFGSGLAPKAPGTFGTLATFPIYALLIWLGGNWALAAGAILFFFAGIWASSITGRALGVSDHSGIVVDEIAAFLLVLLFTPATLIWLIVAFVLFRIFDILKPWPISVADRRIKGGFGVMFDDLLAAIFSIFCIWFLRSIFQGVTS
jgi:phosphatidylglycerophosphatase A